MEAGPGLGLTFQSCGIYILHVGGEGMETRAEAMYPHVVSHLCLLKFELPPKLDIGPAETNLLWLWCVYFLSTTKFVLQ